MILHQTGLSFLEIPVFLFFMAWSFKKWRDPYCKHAPLSHICLPRVGAKSRTKKKHIIRIKQQATIFFRHLLFSAYACVVVSLVARSMHGHA